MGNKRERENVYRKSGHHRHLMAKGVSVRAVNNYKFNFFVIHSERMYTPNRGMVRSMNVWMSLNRLWIRTKYGVKHRERESYNKTGGDNRWFVYCINGTRGREREKMNKRVDSYFMKQSPFILLLWVTFDSLNISPIPSVNWPQHKHWFSPLFPIGDHLFLLFLLRFLFLLFSSCSFLTESDPHTCWKQTESPSQISNELKGFWISSASTIRTACSKDSEEHKRNDQGQDDDVL